MKHFHLPHIGSRNLKTALAVFICLLFLNQSLMASIAAIICMQSTIEDSVSIGFNRLFGTLIGGLLGIIIIYLVSVFKLQDYIIFIAAGSVSLIIYICTIINKPAACVISSIVILGIVIEPSVDNQIPYAIARTIETSLGIIIAVLINRFINPPNKGNLSIIENLSEELEITNELHITHSKYDDEYKDENTLETSSINEKDNSKKNNDK